MKLATIDNHTREGALVRVSDDLGRMIACARIVGTMQSALEAWDEVAPRLAALDPLGPGSEPFEPARALAPLPRAWQWLDGSAFVTHGDLMQKAYDLPPIARDVPLMYQGMSHHFASWCADMRFPDEAHGIDFEAEFAVVVDDVPMGTSAGAALGHIKLIVLLNDWSLRALGAAEMRTGFGWVRAKPACSVAPVALTPEALGDAWRDGRVHLPVLVDYGGARFGSANGGEMGFGFHELVAHAAATRDLCAGTIIGSGTVSNAAYRTLGSSCIAERRAIEAIDHGAPVTPFMRFGESVRIAAGDAQRSPFGILDQKVVGPGGACAGEPCPA